MEVDAEGHQTDLGRRQHCIILLYCTGTPLEPHTHTHDVHGPIARTGHQFPGKIYPHSVESCGAPISTISKQIVLKTTGILFFQSHLSKMERVCFYLKVQNFRLVNHA